jgi:hypothetical protein
MQFLAQFFLYTDLNISCHLFLHLFVYFFIFFMHRCRNMILRGFEFFYYLFICSMFYLSTFFSILFSAWDYCFFNSNALSFILYNLVFLSLISARKLLNRTR